MLPGVGLRSLCLLLTMMAVAVPLVLQPPSPTPVLWSVLSAVGESPELSLWLWTGQAFSLSYPCISVGLEIHDGFHSKENLLSVDSHCRRSQASLETLVDSETFPRALCTCPCSFCGRRKIEGTWLRSATVVHPLLVICSSMWHLGLRPACGRPTCEHIV